MTATSSLPVAFFFPPPIRPISLCRKTEKRRQSLDPLIHQLPAMDEHQRVDAALGNQPRGNDRLSKRCGRGKHAGVVGQHLACGRLLLRSQLPLKRHIQRLAGEAFVANVDLDLQIGKQALHFLETSSRQGEMMRVILGAGNNPWLAVRRQTHGLRFVELRILKRRNPEQSIPQRRWQPVLLDVDLVAKRQFQSLRQRTGNRGLGSST